MTFKHDFLLRHEMIHETTPNGRMYRTPIGLLPSVTTILGNVSDKSGLAKWRENIGENAASQIVKQSQNRGNAIHQLCEDYLMNDPEWKHGVMPINMATFKHFKPILDESVETVYGIELPLWSERLQTAGKTDLVAKWKGTNVIGDYKTARKHKSKHNCLGYFLQATAYSLMVEERYDIKIPNIVVLLMVDNEYEPNVYLESRDKYIDQVENIFIKGRQNEVVQTA